jgi:hypothetical protein
MNRLKHHWKFLLLILMALIFRFSLSWVVVHVDMFSNAGWGESIYKYGSLNFYDRNVWFFSWPTQPPVLTLLMGFAFQLYELITQFMVSIGHFIAVNHLGANHILWYYDFIKWFSQDNYGDIFYHTGLFISLKIIPIFSDLFIAAIIYFLAVRAKSTKGLFLSAAYLFLPFSWYLSSLWGQYDQTATLLLLLSVLALGSSGFFILSLSLFMLSAQIKPTTLVFMPLIGAWFLKMNTRLWVKALTIVLVALISLSTLMVFSRENPVSFATGKLYSMIFKKTEFRVSTASFNVWYLVHGNKPQEHSAKYLFIPAKYWSMGFFASLNILVLAWTFRKKVGNEYEKTFTALFIVGFGSWLLMTNMLERYGFAGLTAGLILAIYYPQIFKYWLGLALIFSLNLYYSWTYPEGLKFIYESISWQGQLLGRIISLVNIAIFVKILWLIRKK